MRAACLLALAFATVLPSPAASRPHQAARSIGAEPRAAIDRITAWFMRRYHVTGLSLGVAVPHAPPYLRGYGVRDPRSRAPADAYTIYAVGSLAKSFIAAAVLREAANGRLDLDAPIGRTLSWVPPRYAAITIRRLLTMTSGIPSYTSLPRARLDAIVAAGGGIPALLAPALREPAEAPPGMSWSYDNSDYLLLAAALERTTGLTWARYATMRFFIPLGMISTSAGALSPFAVDRATGTRWDGRTARPVATLAQALAIAGPAGNLFSNVPDLLRWLTALRDGSTVSPDAFRAMTTATLLPDGVTTGYGMGFFVDDWYGRRVVWHSGYIDGFSSAMALVPSDGTEAVVLCNADRTDLVPLLKSVVAIVDPPIAPLTYASGYAPPENEDPHVTAVARLLLSQIADGRLDRSLLAVGLDRTLMPAWVRDEATLLRAYGTLVQLEFLGRIRKNGVAVARYRADFTHGRLAVEIGMDAGGFVDVLTIGTTP